MQKWIFAYTCDAKKQFTTCFEASDREVAEVYVNIFFRMTAGGHYNPAVLRAAWATGETFGVDGKVFVGSIINEEGEKIDILSGFLCNAGEIKKESESQPNDTELLDKLKSETDFPTI